MTIRGIIFLLIPLLIFIGILIAPDSEDSPQISTTTVVNVQEMIPYELEHTKHEQLIEAKENHYVALVEEWQFEQGAQTIYSYVLRLQGNIAVLQIDAGASSTRSDGYYALQAHSPVYNSDDPLIIGYPIVLFTSEQRLPLNELDVRILYETNDLIKKWRVSRLKK